MIVQACLEDTFVAMMLFCYESVADFFYYECSASDAGVFCLMQSVCSGFCWASV